MRWDTDPDLMTHHERCAQHVDRALRCTCERERASDRRHKHGSDAETTLDGLFAEGGEE